MTREIERELLKTNINANHSKEDRVIVKYFNPFGVGTWLIVAGAKQPDGDWNLYGYNNLGEWEWGTVRLSELESITIPVFNGKIERDRFNTGTVAALCG